MLGGVPEWRDPERAVVWLIGTQFAALLVLHLFISPYQLWRLANASAEAASDTEPITYVDLAALAGRDLGWHFNAAITMFGRRIQQQWQLRICDRFRSQAAGSRAR
jgi:hypothetical protein